MVKSKSSMSASDKRFYDNQRAGFRKLAERAENSTSGSYRNKLIARMARAAEGLVGTQRAVDLLGDRNLQLIAIEMRRSYDILGTQTLGALESMLDNSTLNNPLGAGFTDNEWQGMKDAVQGYVKNLEVKGYSVDEIAAALAYDRYMVRRR